jgi:3-dehydroquinate dehydratase/shikimate dehydrogenase
MTAEFLKTTALICAPVTETNAEDFLSAIEEAARTADAIELRLDYLDDLDLWFVLTHLPVRFSRLNQPLILTYRPREQGGQRRLSLADRLHFWQRLPEHIKAVISFADFELDLVESLSQTTPPVPWERVICSHHDFRETPENLREIYERLARTPAAIVKLAVKANRVADCLPIFELMERSSKPVIALGMDLPGIATRILALSRGALLTFGALRRGAESASGQPTVDELRHLYRADKLTKESLVTGVIGNPIGHSRSPLIHNTALGALGLDAVYLPFEVDDLEEFVRDFVRPATRKTDWRLRGLSVTIPHKLSIMPQLDFIDPMAQRIGAVNTVLIEDSELRGYNTDVIGAMKPLEELIELRDARVAVIGAGGAARAICFGLNERGARATIYARDPGKAQTLADEFNAQAASLEDFAGGADIVINCTPVGMHGHDEGNSPLTTRQLTDVRLVYDLIYNPLETQLLKEAAAAGCQTLGGMAMLIGQAAEQFRLWTGREAPVELMMRTVLPAK